MSLYIILLFLLFDVVVLIFLVTKYQKKIWDFSGILKAWKKEFEG
ncbi:MULTISPECIES: hypothetical protein [unclassified Flavobacterium]|jgi:hypothetical protein|nr:MULTISPECIES: hypothetical protein [unclassified Flavobacterium]MEA9413551.1 hypothetical protein [Flavobacterium sp. PL02]